MRMFTLLQSGFGIVIIVLVAVVHIGFAMAVKRDADNMVMRKGGLFLVPPGLWAFATLLGGVTIAVAYWAVHYSTLRPHTADKKEEIANN